MLSTGGMLRYAEKAEREAVQRRAVECDDAEWLASDRPKRREAIVATEVGMLYPLRMAAPDVDFIPANAQASCVFMKMITLPKLRDCLRELHYEVRVPAQIAERARIPIDRMVAIG